MSLMKKALDTLENGEIKERYLAAIFVVSSGGNLKQICINYNLAEMKLKKLLKESLN